MGIFVEDRRSGKEAIHELARKVFVAKNIRQGIHMRFAPRGDMFSAEKMKAYAIPLLKQHQDVSKIVICVDSECSDPGGVRRRVNSVERALAESELGTPIRYVVVVHALEGWLAADADAVGQVLRRDISGDIPGNLESVCKPADLLSEIFEKFRKDFRRTQHDPIIAKFSDPMRIADRNASFKHFQDAITDP